MERCKSLPGSRLAGDVSFAAEDVGSPTTQPRQRARTLGHREVRWALDVDTDAGMGTGQSASSRAGSSSGSPSKSPRRLLERAAKRLSRSNAVDPDGVHTRFDLRSEVSARAPTIRRRIASEDFSRSWAADERGGESRGLLAGILNAIQAASSAASGSGERGRASTFSHPSSPSSGAAPAARTTLMFRNLPECFSRSRLEELLNQEGFRGSYDFLYTPGDHATGICCGYAFVNLVTEQAAQRFEEHFQGFSDWPEATLRRGFVQASEAVQGLEEQIERYRNSPVMHPSVHDDARPAIYRGGVRATFPSPTVPLVPPRARLSARRSSTASNSPTKARRSSAGSDICSPSSSASAP